MVLIAAGKDREGVIDVADVEDVGVAPLNVMGKEVLRGAVNNLYAKHDRHGRGGAYPARLQSCQPDPPPPSCPAFRGVGAIS